MKEISRRQLLVISGMTTILLILVSVLVPLLLNENLNDKVVSRIELNSETLNNWSVMPGSFGIENKKEFIFLSLNNNLG